MVMSIIVVRTMSIDNGGAYSRKVKTRRLVMLMDPADLAAIDEWAIPRGKASRSEAVRELIKAGLKLDLQTKNTSDAAA